MNPVVLFVARLLTFLTFLTDVGIVLFVISWPLGQIVKPIGMLRKNLLKIISPWARILALIVALAAFGGSMFFSEIVKYPPCTLCWWQRIFLYPQVILLTIGILKNDNDAADYSIALSSVGGLIALYHLYIQSGGIPLVPCSKADLFTGCANRFTLELGYITIPIMSLTAFAALIILMQLAKKNR
jgi:disulfide bond formation protein DsbB